MGRSDDAEALAMKLPNPQQDGPVSIEKALGERRSVRSFSSSALTLQEISQLLWAAQGTTSPDGARTAPSAGALYPLEVFLVAAKVEGLPAGVYQYILRGHELQELARGDKRSALCSASLNQDWMQHAPASVVIAAVYERTTRKYRERGKRYVHMEVGHASQNVSLQAVALGLGTTVVAAFDDARVKEVLGLPTDVEPLNILPIGHIRAH